MDNQKKSSLFLGIDIGSIHSRAAFFNIVDGKYRLIGSSAEQTSLDDHLAGGVGHAMRTLQKTVGHNFLNSSGGLITPPVRVDEGVDHMAMVVSCGEWVRCGLIGLSEDGSLAAGKALLNSLPIKMVSEYGLAHLSDQEAVIENLVNARLEIILITGGEEEGELDHLREWVEVVRLVLRIIPPAVKPIVVYAGNSALSEYVSRRLEPMCTLYQRPNLFPGVDGLNLTPTQLLFNQLILQIWEKKLTGLSDLGRLSKGLKSTTAFAHDRIIRYLGGSKGGSSEMNNRRGVLAFTLGGSTSVLSARSGDHFGTVIQHTGFEGHQSDLLRSCKDIFQWTASNVTYLEVEQYVLNNALHPMMIPETVSELAISQALVRFRIKQLIQKFGALHGWLDNYTGSGLKHQFEPIIVSGDVFIEAPQPGQLMLMVLDSLQPFGITTIVLDQYQLMTLLGVIGSREPILPVHVLASGAFTNLGTVIAPISLLSEGKQIMTIHVNTDAGKSYDVDIHQGTLRRLVIPTGVTAILDIEPDHQTDVGFGGFGLGGQLKVTGGLSGVVVDARGRPIKLPDNDEDRVALLRQWHGVVGG